MKKLTLLFAVAFAVVGSAMAQMAIPGEVFAGNPARFNGRKVTIKNIEIVKGLTQTMAVLRSVDLLVRYTVLRVR